MFLWTALFHVTGLVYWIGGLLIASSLLGHFKPEAPGPWEVWQGSESVLCTYLCVAVERAVSLRLSRSNLEHTRICSASACA